MTWVSLFRVAAFRVVRQKGLKGFALPTPHGPSTKTFEAEPLTWGCQGGGAFLVRAWCFSVILALFIRFTLLI